MKNKLIVTAALSGGTTTKNNNPATPYSPEEFAEESVRCQEEGATIVHIHTKDPNTGLGTFDVQRTRDTIEAIRDRCPELIINISTGGPGEAEDRIAPVVDLKPEMASFNTNSMNFGVVNHKTGQVLYEFIYENTFKSMAIFAEGMKSSGVKPEFEIFDPGGLYNVSLVAKQKDYFTEPMHFQFVYGTFGGMTFDPLLHMSLVKMLPEGATYSVCGVGPWQSQSAVISSITGGHIRIGLEDNVRMPNGELAKGSWEQIRWVKELAVIADRPLATVEETRNILKL